MWTSKDGVKPVLEAISGPHDGEGDCMECVRVLRETCDLLQSYLCVTEDCVVEEDAEEH